LLTLQKTVMDSPVISRLAPTPSGYLHLGNAFNFLLTALLVDFQGGHLHLRIDDLDDPRVERSAVEDIFVQLEWLGIKYDSGPSGPDELFSKFSQRFRMDLYHESLELLRKSGRLFACECSRSEIREISSNGNYPGTCRNKKLNLLKGNQTWRILVPVQTLVCLKTFTNKIEKIDVSREMADFVIKRRDGLPAYQLASIMDDLELGVNLVVRGYDLRSSTGAQLYLAKCLNDSIFPETRFVHHVLQTDDAGDKLSKSKGAHSIQMLREKHRNPTWIYQETAKSLNLPFEEIQTLEDLKEVFRSIMILKDGPNSILDHKN